MTIDQIQYFLAIKRYNGFSTAANELSISQSSLSKQIKALESELDVVLFDRTARSVKLTIAGEAFFIYAEQFLADYNQVIQGMKKYALSNKSTLKLGTIAVLTQYKLTSLIATFKNKYPTIDIDIFEGENDTILSMLHRSEIDFGIVRDFNLPRDLFNVTTIANDELVVVTSINHPFAKKKYISFEQLKDEKFIICTQAGVYDIFLTECNKFGFNPNIIHNINKIETILGLVSEDLGITVIVNAVLKPFNNPNVSVHAFKKPIEYNLALVTNLNAHRTKELNSFENFLIENSEKK